VRRFAPDKERVAAWADRHHRTILATLVALELAVGLTYAAALGPELRYWDEREYMQLATSIIEQHAFRFKDEVAFRPPLYPLVVAGVRWVGGGVYLLRAINVGLMAATMVILDRIASARSGGVAGLVAASLVLVNPVVLYTTGTAYPQCLAGFLLVLFVALVSREPRRSLYGAGLVFALLVLTVPAFAPLMGVVILWLWAEDRRRGLIATSELAVGAVLPVAAWTLRNHHLLGSWVFVATNSGLNLLYGNCESASPDSGVNADISRYLAAASSLGEVDRDHYFREMALQWIRANPWDAAALYVGKFLHYFSSSDRLATPGEGSAARAMVATVAYLPVLCAVLIRPLLAKRRPLERVELLVLSLYMTNAAFAAAFFTRVRFRVPADLLAFTLVGFLVAIDLGGHRHERGASVEAP